jgi:autotransporter-associated beta strand protein
VVGNLLLTAGTGRSDGNIDALIGVLKIGEGGNGTGNGPNTATGTFEYDAGTVDATQIILGHSVNTTKAGIGNGTLNLKGGTLTVGASGIQIAVKDSGSPVTPVGALNLTGGTATVGADITAGGGTSSFLLDGASLDLQGHNLGGTTLIGTLTLASGTLQNLGQLNNGANLVKSAGSGTNRLVLSGTNSFTGNIAVQNGTLTLGSATALPSGRSITLGNASASGTLDLGGFNASISSLTTAGSGLANTVGNSSTTGNSTLTFAGAGTNTFGGIIQDAVGAGTKTTALTVTSGTMSLTGANTYSGATNVTGGALILSGSGSLGNTAITMGTGTTFTASALGGTLNAGSTSTVSVGASLNLGVGSAFTMGDATAGGTFNLLQGTGFSGNALTVGAASGAAPVFTFDAGKVGGNNLADLLAAGGVMFINATGATISINQLGTALDNGTYNLITYGSKSGTGSFSFTGGATKINVGGGRAYTLNITATAEQLVVANVSTPTTAYWTGAQGSAWNTINGAGNLTNWATDATGVVDTNQVPGATTDVFFTTSGAANFVTTLGQDFSVNSLNFTGTATPAASNGITIGGNTLTIGAGGVTVAGGSAAHLIQSNVVLGASQTWTINNSAASPLTVSGSVTGSASLTKSGSGLLILSGASNAWTGSTTITGGGAIEAAALNALPTSTSLTLGDATSSGSFTLNGFDQSLAGLSGGTFGGNQVVNGSATAVTLSINNGVDCTYVGNLGGAGTNENNFALAKSGAGNLTLNGNSTYTGGTTINAGTLQGTTNSIHGAVANNGTLVFDQAFDGVFGNDLTGLGGVVKQGSGGVALTGTNNYFGGTTILAGVLAVGSDANLGNGNPANPNIGITIDGGTLRTVFGFATQRSITLGTNNGTMQIDADQVVDAQGVISGPGSLTVTGGGTLQMSGTNSYAGSTTVINGSTLSVGDDGHFGAVPLTPAPANVVLDNGTLLGRASFTISANRGVALGTGGGTFNVSSGNSMAVAGVVSDVNSQSGALTKSGAGTLELRGANTYSNGTTVNAGTLLATNNTGSATGSGAVNVNANATLGGTGTITGTVNLNAGSTITGGVSAADTTKTGNISLGATNWAGGGTYVWKFNNGVNGTAGSSNGWDLISFTSLSILADGSNTPAGKITIKITGLESNLPYSSAPPVDTNGGPQNSYAYQIGRLNGPGAINGFDAGKFVLDVSNFTPVDNGGPKGFWTLGMESGGSGLDLFYATPTPEPTALAVVGLAAFLLGRRPSRKKGPEEPDLRD